MSFLSIQLLNELLYPFHLAYNLSPFFSISFSVLTSFWIVFCNSFSKRSPTISSSLRSLIRIYGIELLTFLMTKISCDRFGVQHLAKIFLYFDITTISSILNLDVFSSLSLIKSIYVLDFTSVGFFLIVLWYVFFNYIISFINTLFHYSNYYIISISYTIILPKLFNGSIEKFIAFVYPYFIWFAIRIM